MEFGLKQVANRFELSHQALFDLVRNLVCHWGTQKSHKLVTDSCRPAHELDSIMEFGLNHSNVLNCFHNVFPSLQNVCQSLRDLSLSQYHTMLRVAW